MQIGGGQIRAETPYHRWHAMGDVDYCTTVKLQTNQGGRRMGSREPTGR